MTWNTVLWILGSVWLTGWMIVAILKWASSSLYRRPGATNDSVHDKLIATLIYFGWWPILLGPMVEQFRFYYAVRRGKLPSWVLYNEEEDSAISWAPDGVPAFASANAGHEGAPSCLLFDFEGDEITGRVEYRVRMVAPTEEQWPQEWRPMEFDASTTDAGASRYQVELQLGPGKYHVAFRVQGSAKQLDESPVATLIVDPDIVNSYFA